MKNNALGLDDEPVREYVKKRKAESVGHGMTATRDLKIYEEADILIAYLSEKVAARMRKTGVRGYGIHLSIRSGENVHSYVSMQKNLTIPFFPGATSKKKQKRFSVRCGKKITPFAR